MSVNRLISLSKGYLQPKLFNVEIFLSFFTSCRIVFLCNSMTNCITFLKKNCKNITCCNKISKRPHLDASGLCLASRSKVL